MKRILALTACLVVAAGAFAQNLDLGVDLSGTGTYSQTIHIVTDEEVAAGTDPGMQITGANASLSVSTSFYLRAKFASGNTFRFRLGTTLSPYYDFVAGDGGAGLPSSWDAIGLSELAFGVRQTLPDESLAPFAMNLGRFAYADPTAAIYSGTLDGLTLGFTYPALSIDAVLGYTGLLWNSSSPVSMSVADALDTESLVGARRLLFGAGLRVPLFGQSFYLSLLAQEDMRDDAAFIEEYSTEMDATKGGPVDTQYASLGASGVIAEKLSYSAFGILETGRVISYIDDASSATGGRYLAANVAAGAFGLRLAMSLIPGLTGGLAFQYGSGDPDSGDYVDGNTAGTACQFTAITQRSVGLVMSPQLGNSTHVEVSVGWKPFPSVTIGVKSLSLSSKTFCFLKSGDGPASVAGVLSAASETQDPGALLGLEEDISASMKLLSDLTLNAAFGVFMPFTAPFGAYDSGYDGTGPQFLARIGFSLSM